jgi:hypothetical protein
MKSLIENQSRWLVMAGAMGLAASVASGAVTALTIAADSSLGSGVFEVTTDDGTTLPDGTFIWSLDSPMDIVDGGTGETIARLLFGSIMMSTAGTVSHSFVLQSAGVDTNFSLGSGLVNTGLLLNPEGRTSAGVTLTDTDGNGASLTGNMNGGMMFEAFYDNGAVFSNLLGGFGFGTAFDSQAIDGEFPGGDGNFAAFAGPVNEIGIGWDFTLSANDSAGGTSVFAVIPAPATGLGFLVGAGLFSSRRRR